MNRKRVWLAAGGLVAIGIALAVGVMYEPAIAPIAPPPPTAFEPTLKREGARIVALGDCAVCHTSKNGKPFAGGLPLATPFGTIYATNITPDAATGIGRWSERAFARALRRGISRDGHQLYPAFPYVHFTRMSDRDIAAAYAYLMSREPVSAATPPNRLIFPLNFRPLVAFWNILFLRAGPREPDAARDAEWNRGRLLVDGLGHCAACHSPLNAIGGEKPGWAFDGGLVDGWEAPPLNRLAQAVKPWTKAQLTTYLRTGLAPEHGAAAGPMLPVTRELATVPVEDVQAIATYVLSLQQKGSAGSENSEGAGGANAHAVAADMLSTAQRQGAVLFAASCAQCHGPASPMQAIGLRPSLAWSTAVNASTPRNAIQTIRHGIDWHGEDAINYMPAFRDVYDDEQIASLAAYVRQAYSTKPAWANTADMAATLEKEDSAR
ncbi:cytochrome c [Trinickia caryophylli]|uniref:Cytochrome c, mono-and diheme variants n=1 Tax=Trinickia caryophylli TaxID=28094 RepID=A0A1X7HCN7_TRICW|nr:c-type cytochrome [Trinickia caryophylli]PMS13660.1 cytochrome C [Trinickia caryophylli]TRX14154.1 c-type cytochrome [Trinickia caryophylli]WQE13976.1 cytochrome c [Trinickia caryophylli]SMF83077.1 Cytochrome c, mono-and diheme variants [Trinickia caryophylli]GLU33543.1 hypothetical protein Busp01_33850 [Trinickia caryophylli]